MPGDYALYQPDRVLPGTAGGLLGVPRQKVRSSKPPLMRVALAVVVVVGTGSIQRVYPQQPQSGAAQNALELLPVQGNISMLAGAGGNITVQVGRDGILLVDSGVATMSEQVVEAIQAVSRSQVTYIVNTSDRRDHVGGNEHFARTGRPLPIARAAQASGVHHRFQHHPGPDERSHCQAADSRSRVAERHVLRAAEEHLLQWRSRPNLPSIGDQGRRQHGAVPAVRRRQYGRSVRSDPVPVHRREELRQSSGRPRGTEPAPADGDSADHVEGGTMIIRMKTMKVAPRTTTQHYRRAQ